MIRRCPNGETRQVEDLSSRTEYIGVERLTRRTETSQYPEEEKANSDSPSSGERTGRSLNRRGFGYVGVVGPALWITRRNRSCLESSAREGESPVGVSQLILVVSLSTTGPEKSRRKLPAPSGKAKYSLMTDSEPVP